MSMPAVAAGRDTERMTDEDNADEAAAALLDLALTEAEVSALLDAALTEAEAAALLDVAEATEGYAEATVRPR
jgi:hypothetical protein